MRWILAVGLVIMLTGVAAGQDTGSSMGGGDWGGGGGGGDYSGGGGGDYSYSGGGGDYSYSGGGGSIDGSGWLIMIVIVGGIIASVVQHMMKERSLVASAYGGAYGSADPVNEVDVTALRIGLDARVRPFVQKELDRIARTCNTGTPQGLLMMLHEVALLLRRLRDAWVYGGAENHAMSWKSTAQATFQQHAAHARSLFKTELVRNAAGTTTTADAAPRAPRADEGPGLVLVTLVVAARQELFTVTKIGDGDGLRRALEVLSGLTSQTLIAVEVIWTPAHADDRMSSVELEQMLPDDIFPIQGGMVGKVVCSYCTGPFPAELMSCPHCGAPARDVGAPRSAG